jgi:hypothetical protein
VVRHYNRHGEAFEFDFAELPVAPPMQASLAALFAARCSPDRWSVHSRSKAAWGYVRQFTQFLARQQQPPRDLDGLTMALVRQWRAVSTYTAETEICSLLRDDVRLQAGRVADELARRVKPPRGKVQSYGEAEFDQIIKAARRTFRPALQRINDNALHLQRWRDGAVAEDSTGWVIGEGLDALARTGELPCYTFKNGNRDVKARYRNAFGREKGSLTWQRLFLTRDEAVTNDRKESSRPPRFSPTRPA